jgi:hypothetical protein
MRWSAGQGEMEGEAGIVAGLGPRGNKTGDLIGESALQLPPPSLPAFSPRKQVDYHALELCSMNGVSLDSSLSRDLPA